jgi:MFS family permease
VILVFIPVGYILDAIGKEHQPYGLFGVMAFGCVVGFVDLVIHRTIPEPPIRKKPLPAHLVTKILEPFRHRQFRGWLLFIGYWNFAMLLGSAIAFMYFFKVLEVSNNYFLTILIMLVLPLTGTALTAGRIGAAADRIGVRMPLRICYLLWAILPFIWIVATKETAFYWLACSFFVSTVASTSAANIGTKISTRVAPEGKEAMFVAVTTFFSYLTGAVGSFIGGTLIAYLKDFEYLFIGKRFVGYHLIFIISGVLCLCSMSLIRFIPEPPGTRASSASGAQMY